MFFSACKYIDVIKIKTQMLFL